MATQMEDGLKARLERAKAEQKKPNRAERRAAAVVSIKKPDVQADLAKAVGKEAEKALEIGKTASAETSKTEDLGKVKKTKKLSQAAQDWRALPKEFPLGTAKIHILVGDKIPKREGAATRFMVYKEGMTVDEYCEASVKASLNTKGGAREDVRWDFVKKFISFE